MCPKYPLGANTNMASKDQSNSGCDWSKSQAIILLPNMALLRPEVSLCVLINVNNCQCNNSLISQVSGKIYEIQIFHI